MAAVVSATSRVRPRSGAWRPGIPGRRKPGNSRHRVTRMTDRGSRVAGYGQGSGQGNTYSTFSRAPREAKSENGRRIAHPNRSGVAQLNPRGQQTAQGMPPRSPRSNGSPTPSAPESDTERFVWNAHISSETGTGFDPCSERLLPPPEFVNEAVKGGRRSLLEGPVPVAP